VDDIAGRALVGEAVHGPVKILTRGTRAWLALVQWRVHQPSAGFYRDHRHRCGPQPGRPPSSASTPRRARGIARRP